MYSGYINGSQIHSQVVLFSVGTKPIGQVQGKTFLLTVNLDASAFPQGPSAYSVSNSLSSGDAIM